MNATEALQVCLNLQISNFASIITDINQEACWLFSVQTCWLVLLQRSFSFFYVFLSFSIIFLLNVARPSAAELQ